SSRASTAPTGSAGPERRSAAGSRRCRRKPRRRSSCSPTGRSSTRARSTGSWARGRPRAATSSRPPTAGSGSIPSCSPGPPGRTFRTRALGSSQRASSTVTTSVLPATWTSADDSGKGSSGRRRNENVVTEQAPTLEAIFTADESPLARARLHRQLTVEEAARRADVSPDEVQWLEEGRLYRFPSPDRAVLVTILYATALGIEHREALELAGLPTPPLPANPLRRLGAFAAIAALVLAAVLAVVLARSSSQTKPSTAPAAASTLPAPWAIKVVVLNGSGDIVYT